MSGQGDSTYKPDEPGASNTPALLQAPRRPSGTPIPWRSHTAAPVPPPALIAQLQLQATEAEAGHAAALSESQRALLADVAYAHARGSAHKEHKIHLAFRVYGLLALLGGALTLASYVISAAGTTFDLFQTQTVTVRLLLDYIKGLFAGNLAVLVLYLFQFLATGLTAAGLTQLGWKLLHNDRRHAGRLANVLIFLTIAEILGQLMLSGMGPNVVLSTVSLIMLIAISSFVDPSLVQERIQRQKMRQLDSWVNALLRGRDVTGQGYANLNHFNLFWLFMVASVLGLIIETVYRLLTAHVLENRTGVIYGPFSPVYGFGAVLLTIVLNRMYKQNSALIFVLSALLGGAFEYWISIFLEFSFGVSAWDYSGPWFYPDGTINWLTFMNIHGRTNLMFMCFWGLLGLLWIRALLPGLLRVINVFPWGLRYWATMLCTIFMACNLGLTLIALNCWYERAAGNEPDLPIEVFAATYYGDSFMQRHFETMTIDPSRTARASSAAQADAAADAGAARTTDAAADAGGTAASGAAQTGGVLDTPAAQGAGEKTGAAPVPGAAGPSGIGSDLGAAVPGLEAILGRT